MWYGQLKYCVVLCAVKESKCHVVVKKKKMETTLISKE